jgi:hypothetical protein
MPLVSMDNLPDDARTWVFGADTTLDSLQTRTLLAEVDRYLAQWRAHGAPLTVGRDFREGRFLTVAVDQSTEGASGCSIDGLFRALKSLSSSIGPSLVTSGLVFYRDKDGSIKSVDREEFSALAATGQITASTRVFDPTVTTLGEWRARFEMNAADSWHAGLMHSTLPT